MKKEFTHLSDGGEPTMVDVSIKKVTVRTAKAMARMRIDKEIAKLLEDNDLQTKKGPVFQTAILAGIMAVKKTSDLIPLCHPLPVEKCAVDISMSGPEEIEIICRVKVTSKTGVEMEALTGVSVAALTVYDMCKGISHNMQIQEVRLIEKTGGKSDIRNA